MPLIKSKSKKALQSNIKTEMDANPGPEHRAQNLAIAYSTQRAARRKGYARGGEATADSTTLGSVADTIMGRKKMADGGMVDDDNMETPARMSPYDDDNAEAIEKELYEDGDDQIGPEPMSSTGDPEETTEEDEHDMVSVIRRKMRR